MSAHVARGVMSAARPAGFTTVMKALHWITPVLLVVIYTFGWSMQGAQTREQAAWLLMMHRSFGLLLLLTMLFRLGWRQGTPIPQLPPGTNAVQGLAAHLVMVALYGLAILQPLLGLIASELHGDHIRLLGGIALPQFLPVDRPLSRQVLVVHGMVAIALLAVIALHGAAALFHHFVLRDDVLRGMLPRALGGTPR
jgi:cytochrome b561